MPEGSGRSVDRGRAPWKVGLPADGSAERMIPKYAIPRGEAVPGPSPQEAGARVGRQCEHPRERRVHRAHPAVGTLRGHSRVRAEPKELLSLPPGSVGIIRPSGSRCLGGGGIRRSIVKVRLGILPLTHLREVPAVVKVSVKRGWATPLLPAGRSKGGGGRAARRPRPERLTNAAACQKEHRRAPQPREPASGGSPTLPAAQLSKPAAARRRL